MVDDTVFNYLRENYGKYKSEELKKNVLSGGYSVKEFNLSMDLVLSERRSRNRPKAVVHNVGFKWILVGFIFSILMILIYLIMSISSFFSESFSFMDFPIFGLVLSILFLSAVFFYFIAFYKTGVYTDDSFLSISSLILLIVYLVSVVIGIGSSFFIYSWVKEMVKTSFLNVGSGGVTSSVSPVSVYVYLVFVLFLLLGLVFLVSYYFFSVGLIRIRKRIKLAMLAGVFRLVFVSLFTLFLFFLFFIFFKILLEPLTYGLELMTNPSGVVSIFVIAYLGLNILGFFTLIFESLVLFFSHRTYEF